MKSFTSRYRRYTTMMRCLSRGTAPLRLLLLLSLFLTLSQCFHIPVLTQHTTRPGGMIQSRTITTIKTTTMPSTVHSRSTSETALTMFLPPDGGGGGNKDDGLGEVASGILTFLGVSHSVLSVATGRSLFRVLQLVDCAGLSHPRRRNCGL